MYTTAQTPTLPDARPMHPAVNVLVWCGQVLIAVSLFFAGASKLAGAAEAVALFEAVGVGQWFRYVTGLLEVVGAVALIIPRLAPTGVAILSSVMIGAVLTHLFVIGGSPLLPLAHLAILVAVGWARLRSPLGRLAVDEHDEEEERRRRAEV